MPEDEVGTCQTCAALVKHGKAGIARPHISPEGVTCKGGGKLVREVLEARAATQARQRAPVELGDYAVAEPEGGGGDPPSLPATVPLAKLVRVDQLKAHPLADVFPRMGPAELAELTESVRSMGGLMYPIAIFDGQVLDGRNRLAACLAAGVEPAFVDVTDDVTDLMGFVIASNLHRRHLTPSQRALVAAELLAATRPIELPPDDRASREARDPEVSPSETPATIRASRGEGRRADSVAAAMGVSGASVERAVAVVREGAPELVDAVRKGKVDVATAATVAFLPKDEQTKLVAAADLEVIRVVARQHRDQRAAERADKLEAVQAKRAREVADLDTPEGIEIVTADVADVQTSTHGASLIIADPPWLFDQWKCSGAEKHYRLIPTDEVIDGLRHTYDGAANNAVLVLWVVSTHLLAVCRAIAALGEHWQWQDASAGCWLKPGVFTTGHWWRGQVEHVLVFTKGRPVVLDSTVSNGCHEEPAEHSEKPVRWTAKLIRAWCPPGGHVLELYAGLGSGARATHRAGDGRTYRGYEIDERRADLARVRLKHDMRDYATTQKVVRENALPIGR